MDNQDDYELQRRIGFVAFPNDDAANEALRPVLKAAKIPQQAQSKWRKKTRVVRKPKVDEKHPLDRSLTCPAERENCHVAQN